LTQTAGQVATSEKRANCCSHRLQTAKLVENANNALRESCGAKHRRWPTYYCRLILSSISTCR
jgi:hypothetical protein